MLVSDYLRMQSGTAVAEPEFIRLIGGVLAGLESQNPEATAQALKTFADVNAMTARQRADEAGAGGYAYTAASNYKKLADAYKRYGYKMPDAAQMSAVRDRNPKYEKEPQTQTAEQQMPKELRPIYRFKDEAQVRIAVSRGDVKDGDQVIIDGVQYTWRDE
jgi:hypothetical protein